MLTFTWLKWRFMVSDLLGILIYLYNIIALVLTYIRVVQKKAHLLISHNFLSGLCNLMKFTSVNFKVILASIRVFY